jgi:thiol-disulfide isomerase/thioredoxin
LIGLAGSKDSLMSPIRATALAIAAALVLVLGVNFGFAVPQAVERELVTYVDEACTTLQVTPVNARLGKLPAPAPELVAQDVNGKQVPLSAYRGKVVLLNFWASWCPPCVEEMPSMDELQKVYGDDLVVLAVSADESWKDIRDFFDKGTAMTVLWDPSAGKAEKPGAGAIAQAWGTDRLPESFLIDREGVVRYYIVNTRDWSTPDARRCVAKLLER